MTKIEQLNKRKDELFARQEQILNSCEEAKRKPNEAEEAEFKNLSVEIADITTQVARRKEVENGRAALALPTSQPIIPGDPKNLAKASGRRTLSPEYFEAFYKNFGKLGKISNDLLFEGADADSADGGVVAPIIFEGTVIPLAPINMALRDLATVTATSNDIKIPCQVTKSVAAVKQQTTSGGTHSFAATNPTIVLKTLSAAMIGNYIPASIESLQDIGYLQTFVQSDIARAVVEAEEGEYTDVLLDPTDGASVYSASSVTIAAPESFLDIVAAQPSTYDNGSSWLMAKRTAFALRKAQIEANQFTPFFTSQGGRSYFHDYPVYYSSKMQDVGSPAADQVVFGNFKDGLIIGDRNNGAVLIKVDDITGFKDGVINVFGYRRSGALVRNQDALRQYSL